MSPPKIEAKMRVSTTTDGRVHLFIPIPGSKGQQVQGNFSIEQARELAQLLLHHADEAETILRSGYHA